MIKNNNIFNMGRLSFCVGAFIIGLFTVSAQTNEVPKGNIEKQFDKVINNSNNYQNYKVIKKVSLNDLKQNVLKTINELHQNLDKQNKTIDKKSTEITNLQTKLKKSNEDLQRIGDEKDSFSIFGILIEKTLYSIIIWSIIGVLLLTTIIAFTMFKNAKIVTDSTKKEFKDIEQEFEKYKHTSLEKEQKIKRELQNYKNKEKYGDS